METRSSRARLRRTFQYPDDSDTPETLDEQEQESLIEQLSSQNAQTNTSFTTILLFLPTLTIFPYIPLLVTNPTIGLLAITSLLSTAYLLYTLPPGETGIAPLDAWIKKDGEVNETVRRLKSGRGDKTPLEMYLPYLNGVLVSLLVVMGLVVGKGGGGFAWIGMGNLPAVVYAVVLVAKVVMGGVDPERELAGLKYGFKGA